MEATQAIEVTRKHLEAMTAQELDDLLCVVDRAIRSMDDEADDQSYTLEDVDTSKMQTSYFSELDKITGDLESKSINLATYDKRMHDSINRNFTSAYKKGIGRPLDDGDLEYLRRATAEEMKYARKFGTDIQNDTLRMPRQQRAAMYSASLNGVASHAKVEAAPFNSQFIWKLGIAEHCPDCIVLSCLLSDNTLISTARGMVPLRDVEVGEQVLTHRGRWRQVLAKPVRQSTRVHKYAVLVTPRGLIGLTDDHRLYTAKGWMPANEVAREKEKCLQGLWCEDRSSCREMQELCGPRENHEEAIRGSEVGALRIGVNQESVCCQLLDRRKTKNGLAASVGMGTGERTCPERLCCASQERRSVRRQIGKSGVENESETHRGSSQRTGRSQLEGCAEGNLLSVVQQEVQALPIEPQEILLSRAFNDVAHRECQDGCDLCEMRQTVQFEEGSFASEVRYKAEQESVLLSRMLSEMAVGGRLRDADPAVRLLWKEFQSGKIPDQKLKVGQVLLLKGVLPQGTPLYDLTVEEDHSFVVESMVLHNSNSPYTKATLPTTPRAGATRCLSRCKCSLIIQPGKLSKSEIAELTDLDLRKDQSLLEVLKPPTPPKGMRLPIESERKWIDNKRMQINTNRRIIGTSTDKAKVRDAIMARKAANAELIEFLEKQSIYDVPIWSVDDVLGGRHVGRRVVQDIMRHGIDGKSLSLVGKKQLLSLLNEYERRTGATLSDDALKKALKEKADG